MLKQGKWIGIVAIACIGGLVSAAFVFSAQGPDNQNSGSQVSNSQIDYTQSNGVTKGNVRDTSERETVELTITPTAIGPAQLGMTLGELRQSLGDLTLGEPQAWRSDFDGLPVLDGGEVLFYVVYGNYQPMTDSDAIEYLVTEHSNVKTPEGIGPGSTIAEAAAVYGAPTLGYHIESHSREGLQFADLPWSDYSFEPTVLAGDDFFAGIYDATEEQVVYQETHEYREDGIIDSISIDTRGQ